MLQLTHAAATMLGEACREQGMAPEDAGVRVSGGLDEAGQPALHMTLQETPEPDDQVSDQDAVRLFVAPEVAEPLSGVVIDAVDSPEGPELQLREQDPDD